MRSRRRNAPSVPATLQRSASASSRRFSLPENCRRLAFATTSGSRRGASSEAISPAALRAPSEAASEEEPSNPFMEDFSNEVMVMSYLYSKLPETGVSPHIGTEGRVSQFDEGYAIDPDLAKMIPEDLIWRKLSPKEAADMLSMLKEGPQRPYALAG